MGRERQEHHEPCNCKRRRRAPGDRSVVRATGFTPQVKTGFTSGLVSIFYPRRLTPIDHDDLTRQRSRRREDKAKVSCYSHTLAAVGQTPLPRGQFLPKTAFQENPSSAD